MSVKERLLEFLYYKHLSQAEFTRLLGVSSTYVAAMRRSISDDKMRKIRKLFPELNTAWLLYGEGGMLTGKGKVRESATPPSYIGAYAPEDCESACGNADNEYAKRPDSRPLPEECSEQRLENQAGYFVPLLPTEACAGGLQYFSQGVSLRDCEMVVSPVPGVDFAIRVTGDSMEPAIHSGAVIYIRRINDRAFIPWGTQMVIDTENGVLVKEVYPDADDTDIIEARSLNPKYPPLHIPRSSIYGLYRILGAQQLYSTY